MYACSGLILFHSIKNRKTLKKNLLLFSFLLITFSFVTAQNMAERKGVSEQQINVFPNPASDFISVNNDDNVKTIVVYNIVGRKVKQFEIEHSGAQYDIKDLPDGLYSVHLVGKNNKVINTQRLTVR